MTDYKIIGVFQHWNVFDSIPEGWVIDRNAGSPLHDHVFVTNGKNILSGQQIRALAPDPQKPRPIIVKGNFRFSEPMPEAKKAYRQEPEKPFLEVLKEVMHPKQNQEKEKPSRQIDQECRRVLNDLARKKVQEQLLQDILFDMNVCKLEGWDHRKYLFELENLIDRLIIDSLKEERESGQ